MYAIRSYYVRSTLSLKKITRVDELRRAAEDLGDQYYKLDYFERTTSALRTVLLEKGLITDAELKAKMAEVRARFNVPHESRITSYNVCYTKLLRRLPRM